MRKRRTPPRPRNPVAAAIRTARWRTRRAANPKAYSRKGRRRPGAIGTADRPDGGERQD